MSEFDHKAIQRRVGVLIMLWLPIVFLTLMMLVVATAFALMFCSVAFAGWNGGSPRPSAAWELPTMSGKRLRFWAANLAHRVVARHTHQPRSAETPLAIATELVAGANAVLEQAAQRMHGDIAKTCPNRKLRQIGVTAPEVFAIAAELERNYPKSEVELIRDFATANAHRTRFILPSEFSQAGIACPLRTKDGHCLTFSSRPISCRCLSCPCTGTKDCGNQCGSTGADLGVDVSEQLHEGMTDGLCQGLRQEGLESDTYELNAALATALAEPRAASRWAHGEVVFANCAKV